MKLGLSIGYSGATLNFPTELVKLADRLGYDTVWTAEAYGTDAMTPLAYLAAVTERIKLGTGIIQLAARTAANAAMQAQTIDALAGGGRMIVGIGVSGPQIVEGWYGEPWGRPYWRIKDYVAIMRKIFAREEPVTHDGREISLPYTGEGSAGMGKPLRMILHPNPDIPIYLGTGSESTVRLTGEIADGWLPLGFMPGTLDEYRPWLEQGFARAGNGKGFHNFEIVASPHVILTDDVKAGLAQLKPREAGMGREALYVGGMGQWVDMKAGIKNFHNAMMPAGEATMARASQGDAGRAHPGALPRRWRPQGRTATGRPASPCRTNGWT